MFLGRTVASVAKMQRTKSRSLPLHHIGQLASARVENFMHLFLHGIRESSSRTVHCDRAERIEIKNPVQTMNCRRPTAPIGGVQCVIRAGRRRSPATLDTRASRSSPHLPIGTS
jgi:hypothetical protein